MTAKKHLAELDALAIEIGELLMKRLQAERAITSYGEALFVTCDALAVTFAAILQGMERKKWPKLTEDFMAKTGAAILRNARSMADEIAEHDDGREGDA